MKLPLGPVMSIVPKVGVFPIPNLLLVTSIYKDLPTPNIISPSFNGLNQRGEHECIFLTKISVIQFPDVFPVKVPPDKDERFIGFAEPPLFQFNNKLVPDKVPPVTYVFVSALEFGNHSPSPLLPV